MVMCKGFETGSTFRHEGVCEGDFEVLRKDGSYPSSGLIRRRFDSGSWLDIRAASV